MSQKAVDTSAINRSKFGRVGLLYGGLSSEREISLMTGEAVLVALKNLNVDVIAIDVQKDILQVLPSY